MVFVIGKCFALRSGQEHRNLKFCQLALEERNLKSSCIRRSGKKTIYPVGKMTSIQRRNDVTCRRRKNVEKVVENANRIDVEITTSKHRRRNTDVETPTSKHRRRFDVKIPTSNQRRNADVKLTLKKRRRNSDVEWTLKNWLKMQIQSMSKYWRQNDVTSNWSLKVLQSYLYFANLRYTVVKIIRNIIHERLGNRSTI